MFSTLPAVLRRAGLGTAIRILHYGTIVLAAWAAAVLVVKLAGLDLDPTIPAAPPVGADGAKATRVRRGADDALILKRNLFGATGLEADDLETPVAGESDLKLRGTATAAQSKGKAFAVFENTASGEQNVFAVGEKVFEGPRLLAVDPEGADVLLRGRRQRYEIEDEAAASPVAGQDEAGAKGRGGQAATDAGVRKTGENAYLVDRREVEHAVANLNEVITQARAVPVLQDGKSAGFKLFNIRRGSIFEKIGLLDGDIVQKVNDTELTDPAKAVGLLEDVQSMGQIRVNFVRGGRPRTFTYSIR